jgi:hypothetical protein
MPTKFIKVRLGLIEKEHYDSMGKAVFLYLYILSKTDWEKGEVHGWKDREAAEHFGMSMTTVRSMRKKLEEKGYIASRQTLHGSILYVHKWSDPRNKADIDPPIEGKNKYPPSSWGGPQVLTFIVDIAGVLMTVDTNRLGNVKKWLVDYGEKPPK